MDSFKGIRGRQNSVVIERLPQITEVTSEESLQMHAMEQFTYVKTFFRLNFLSLPVPQNRAHGMYKNRINNGRKVFEIPALLSCKRGNPELKIQNNTC